MPVSLTDWSGGSDWLARLPRQADSVSLLGGSLRWQQGPAPAGGEAPPPAAGDFGVMPEPDFGRLGATGPFALPGVPGLAPGARLRIVGTGEFTYRLSSSPSGSSAEGHDVVVQAASRSPVQVGGPIASALRFRDNYGAGVANYLYNAAPGDGRRTIICHETPPGAWTRSSPKRSTRRSSISKGAARARVVLVDLDDTLFQTLRKCPSDVPEHALIALGFGRDGGALGFATPRQAAFGLARRGRPVVPVTGRSHDALSRVRIAYGAAICAHGGVILDEAGAVDPGWAAQIAARAAPHKAMLAALAEAAQGSRVTARILAESGTDLYLLLKDPEGDETLLDPLLDRVAPIVLADWTIHRNGNNAALMPPFLGKAHAVRALLPRLRALHPDAPVIGIGDSLSDAPYMALCDYAMMPAGSQLSKATLEAL